MKVPIAELAERPPRVIHLTITIGIRRWALDVINITPGEDPATYEIRGDGNRIGLIPHVNRETTSILSLLSRACRIADQTGPPA